MSKHHHSWKRNSGLGCLLVAMIWCGAGCSSSSGQGSTGGSGGQSTGAHGGSAGQSRGGSGSTAISSSGGQGAASSRMGGSSSGTGGASGGTASGGLSGSTGGRTGGTTSSIGGSSATGGATTGGTMGGTSQGRQDGGVDANVISVSDASVDRTPDSLASISDGGSTDGFCPSDGTACKIMAMGDSITDGIGSSGGGYRVPLFKLTVADKKNATFVGRNSNGPGSLTIDGQSVKFPQGHEGYSGWTIKDGGGRSGIYNKVDEAMQTSMPHIILLMIGTNDVNINLDLANAPDRLGELLDKMIADAPKALIVVAKLVPTTNDGTNGRVRTYNDGIAPIVQSRISQGKNLKMVDMYTAFTANANYKTALMSDELHPKDAGYSVMAQTWYDAIKSYLH